MSEDTGLSSLWREACRRVEAACGPPTARQSNPCHYSTRICAAANEPIVRGPRLVKALKLWGRLPVSLKTLEGLEIAVRAQRAWVEAIDADEEERRRAEPMRPDLTEEVTTDEARHLLGVSKDTVLKYVNSGLLPARNIAPPGSSRPAYRLPRAAVLELRNRYERAEPPAAPEAKEPPRRRVKGSRKYIHLRTDGD